MDPVDADLIHDLEIVAKGAVGRKVGLGLVNSVSGAVEKGVAPFQPRAFGGKGAE